MAEKRLYTRHTADQSKTGRMGVYLILILSFEMRPQHPGHLLVGFHEPREIVARPHIVVFLVAGFEVLPQFLYYAFVVVEEGAHHVLGVRPFGRVLFEGLVIEHLLERAERVSAYGPRPLGDVVYDPFAHGVLCLEYLMEIVKLHTRHVPVITPGFRIQRSEE